MSNYKAVAAVTETIKRRLEDVIREPVPEALVTTERPEVEAQGLSKKHPRVNLYLFQATNNPSFRNADLPTRNGDGSLVQRPQVALDLSYLLSFFGDDGLKGQLLMGLATSTLHTDPFLTPAEIEAATRDKAFKDSGLAHQDVRVRIAPLTLTLDELTKFWSGFFQVPYTLSLPYQASVVLLDADRIPQAQLPARAASVSTRPAAALPQLAALQPPVVEAGPGAQVTLVGANLGGAHGVASFAGQVVSTTTEQPQSRVTVPLPAGVPAGTVAVQVGTAQRAKASGSRPLLTSNAVSLIVQPRIDGPPVYDPAAQRVELRVSPAVRNNQTVELLLNEKAFGSPSYSFSHLHLGPETARLAVAVAGAAPGTYLVQLVVAGAASRLSVDAAGAYSSPTVTVTGLP